MLALVDVKDRHHSKRAKQHTPVKLWLKEIVATQRLTYPDVDQILSSTNESGLLLPVRDRGLCFVCLSDTRKQ